MIIKFLLNKGVNASHTAARLQAQFDEHAYQLRMVQSWITEVRIDCQDIHHEIRSGKLPLDDHDATILAILHKSLSKSAHGIAKTLRIAPLTV
jgi:hypothetical protein